MLIDGLYEILEYEQEQQQVASVIKLNKDHSIFEGHFPGHPVMPGVCIIQIIKELTEKSLNKSLSLSVASNVKFMAIINPQKNEVIKFHLALSENEGDIKVKNTVSFDDTLALKLNATFKIKNR